jgi:hypothetical protein
VVVPAGTAGTFGDGDGQLANFNGQLYECKVVTPTTGGSTNTNSNTNQNSNSNLNTNVANATGGSANQHQHQSQTQSINDSGNSSSTSSASANGNGNTTNTNSGNTYVPRQVASAIAPPQYPTSPCFKGLSGAAQGGMFGASLGGGKIDQNCAIIETAKVFAANGSRLAYCMTMVTNKFAKKAGVTLDNCMDREVAVSVEQGPAVVAPEPAPVQPIIVQVQPAPVVIQQAAAPVVVAPTPIAPELKVKSVKRVHAPCYTNDELERMGVPHNKLPQ